jgi:hypothetical protein
MLLGVLVEMPGTACQSRPTIQSTFTNLRELESFSLKGFLEITKFGFFFRDFTRHKIHKK